MCFADKARSGSSDVTNVTVIGAQWGDEGKGKIVDWLSEQADVIVRFQGGHNAGHTLVIDDQVFKLSLVPSGILRPGKLSVIGNGVVLDPWAFVDEVDGISARGVEVSPDNLMIAENASLILPIHGELDRIRETNAGKVRIGTTGRGIGPAYEDKVGRRAVRVADLADEKTLDLRLDRLLSHHDALRNGLGVGPVDREKLKSDLLEIAPRILRFSGPAWETLGLRHRSGSRILFEGAQGTHLDVDFGTYPFVTSSNTVAGAVATGTGIGPAAVGFVLGIVKAYTTRVGEGPFPCELFDETAKHIAKIGREKGTVTGRHRRCGWFDAVLVRKSCATSCVDGIALTKLDVLDGLKQIRICTGYELDGRNLDALPVPEDEQMRVRPVYETLDGWSESTAGARRWIDLPAAAIKFVRRIEELVHCPVALLSTSPEREDVICVSNPFATR